MMKLVVLVPLLPYLLEYTCNSSLFRALSYDVQCMGQYAKPYMCLNSCMGIYGTCARSLQQEGLGHFHPGKTQITLLK